KSLRGKIVRAKAGGATFFELEKQNGLVWSIREAAFESVLAISDFDPGVGPNLFNAKVRSPQMAVDRQKAGRVAYIRSLPKVPPRRSATDQHWRDRPVAPGVHVSSREGDEESQA